MTDIERFMKFVDSNWHWLGGTDGRVHGKFYYHGRTCQASRVAYELFFGPIPDGLFVLHSCDDGLCVNPEHLHIGTQKDNVRECLERNRLAMPPHGSGENNPNAKITEKQVKQIRELIKQGISKSGIGKMFGITQVNVAAIVSGRSWKHIP